MRFAIPLFVSLLSFAGAVPASQAPAPLVLKPEQQALLREAILDGRAVPLDQAIASVRAFCGDPNLEVVFHSFVDTPTGHSQEPAYYHLRIDAGPVAGAYLVRGDGAVYEALRDSDADGETPLTITLEGARTLAKQFARTHYPGFDQKQWTAPHGWPMTDPAGYHFSWQEVLNEHGTLARWPLMIHVDGVTGKIVTYSRPTDRIAGPTVPRISRAQALGIAHAMALYNPALVPFTEVTLEMPEDRYGAQGLVWVLHQTPPETGLRYEVLVDALTGQAVGHGGALGGGPPAKRNRSAAAKKPKVAKQAAPITLRSADGKVIRATPPELREERLWVRVELLRGFGARLAAEPQRLLVRAGNKRVEGPALGGEFRPRDNGWWVPLRQACDELGWQVTWDAAKREAVVNTLAPGASS